MEIILVIVGCSVCLCGCQIAMRYNTSHIRNDENDSLISTDAHVVVSDVVAADTSVVDVVANVIENDVDYV